MNDDAELPQPGIGWLRVVVWLMPASLFVCIILAPRFVGYDPAPEIEYAVLAALLAVVLVFAWVDARLHCQQMEIPPGSLRAKKIYRSFAFLGGQLLLANIGMSLVAGVSYLIR